MADRKNRMTVDFSALEEYRAKLDALGGDATKRAFTAALKASQQVVKEAAVEAMQPHNRTGHTVRTAVGNLPVKWDGNFASVPVGFEIVHDDSGSGLVSVFLMYGTELYGQPHIPPDRKLYCAVYGDAVRQRCRKIQADAFRKVLERVMK